MKRHESSLCQEACARPGCQSIARPGGEFCSSTCLESRHCSSTCLESRHAPVAPNDCTCTDCKKGYLRHPQSRGTRCPKCVREAKKAASRARHKAAHAKKMVRP